MHAAKDKIRPAPAGAKKDLNGFAAILIVAAVVLAYSNSLTVPFIFDDGPAIEDNTSIRDLRMIGAVLHPPVATGSGVAGRPVVNLTLAVNYAISGLKPWSYHATNLLIHVLAALTLFGLTRRALTGPVCRERWADRSLPVAGGVALVWAVHPLLTESVTCIIQRTESLVSLCLLFTIYAFARATSAGSKGARIAWSVVSVGTCAVGMATKELMVAAPVIALLYDRTFVSGSFRGTLRHRWLHYGLFATWALLFYLMQGNPMRSGTAGYASVTVWDYLLTQCRALVLYLKLAVWPHPLILDYGTTIVHDPLAVLPQALFLLGLGGGTIYALARKPLAGFLGAWFFVILAPSSSLVPLVTQTIAEHRVYLPLAALVALGVGALATRSLRLVVPVCGGAALVLGALTFQRNQFLHHPEAVWRDNLARHPENIRVHAGLAGLADKAGRFEEAVAHYEDYLRLKPENTDIRFNFARDLVKVGRREEARREFEKVLLKRPVDLDVRTNYGACLLALGRVDEAIVQFDIIVRVDAARADNQFNYAEALAKAGRLPEALEHYQKAVELKPQDGFMHFRRGEALLKANSPAPAAEEYRHAVALQPDLLNAWINLGGCYLVLGQPGPAAKAYESALRLKPGDPVVQQNLAYARGLLPP